MPDINDDCVRIDTRLAGQIRRYHTWPITGQQTIAEHCWQILRIYLSVVDDVDPHMVYHIAFHDIGEHYTGDIPYPVKRDNPRLKGEMDFLEQKSQAAQMEYWGSFKQVVLSDYDKKLFKQIEMIEMAEFGIDQMLFGNNHGYIIANRCCKSCIQTHPVNVWLNMLCRG
jgi:5'-deoxynucleotidase YfbR-like HD superfamily hydrolase